jgi:5'-3' exonuclease
MGITSFFSSVDRNFDVITYLEEPYNKLDATHFLIDFNSIIHNVSSEMLSDINNASNLSFTFNSLSDFEPQLIIQVKEAIKNLLKNNFISQNINYVMLAIDGVPSFAKMMEQKKRRYIGDLMNKLMKEVELPIDWSKTNISPGTKFMDDMCRELKTESFINECKKICPNLTGMLVSDVYNPGEGEMKIMKCLRGLTGTKNKICVYSPDSDMILLLMILDIDVSLLRFDQQTSKIKKKKIYNLIDINKFKNELINYCKNRVDTITDERLLINEIIYIFTLFGDDFLPKLESVHVANDINSIIDNYLLTLKEVGNILTRHTGDINNKYTLNHNNLKHFFDLLTKNEMKDINRNFYNSKFRNYRYAKDKNFHLDLYNFKADINNIILKFIVKSNSLKRTTSICTPLNAATCIDVGFFFDFLKSSLDKTYNYNTEVTKFNGNTYSTGNHSSDVNLNQNIYEKIIRTIKESNNSSTPYYNFIYNISKIIDGNTMYHTLYGDGVLGSSLFGRRSEEFKKIVTEFKSMYYLKIKPYELLEDLILYLYLQPLQLPFVNFSLDAPDAPIKLQVRSFELKDHINKLKRDNLLDEKNKRGKLEYIITNKLEGYDKLFNPEHSFYKKKLESTSSYNNTFFPNKDIKTVINKYIEGFEWVLNYYFNDKTDLLWYYPYGRIPLLSDIVKHYPTTFTELNFDEKRNFNPLESIIFITPLEPGYKLTFFPESVTSETINLIQQFMNSNRQFFLPLSEININLTKDITSLPDLLDCSTSIFLSKCHYKLLDQNNDPELFIKNFRKIIPEIKQQLQNNTEFKCINLGLSSK